MARAHRHIGIIIIIIIIGKCFFFFVRHHFCLAAARHERIYRARSNTTTIKRVIFQKPFEQFPSLSREYIGIHTIYFLYHDLSIIYKDFKRNYFWFYSVIIGAFSDSVRFDLFYPSKVSITFDFSR